VGLAHEQAFGLDTLSICASILHCGDKYLVAQQIVLSRGCYVRHAVTPGVSLKTLTRCPRKNPSPEKSPEADELSRSQPPKMLQLGDRKHAEP